MEVIQQTPNQSLSNVAALDTGAFRTYQVDNAIPADWQQRATKGWKYYLEEPIVSNSINAWRTFAIGDDVVFTCEDDGMQTEIRKLAKQTKLVRFVKNMVLQLLVKGECVGYFTRTADGDNLEKLTCVNPTSVKPKYEDGELQQLLQMEEISPGQYGRDDEGQELPLEQAIHLKWNAPDFSPRGNSMVLPAFEDIEMLRDYRKAERAIAKRWTTPLRFIQVGGVYNGKIINPDQRMIDQVRKEINKLDLKSGLVVPFYVKAETYGTEGKVLETEKKKAAIKEDILVALGMARTLVTGDGPNYATASISMQKMVVQLKEIKQAAREILDWVFDEWKARTGNDANIHYGFSDLDLTDEVDQKKVLLELYDRGLISKRTLQQKMGLAPDIETREQADEQIVVDRNWSIQDITQLVALEVMTVERAQQLLGLSNTDHGQDQQSEIADCYSSGHSE